MELIDASCWVLSVRLNFLLGSTMHDGCLESGGGETCLHFEVTYRTETDITYFIALFTQAALGGLALLSLVWKRSRESPQRPLKIW